MASRATADVDDLFSVTPWQHRLGWLVAALCSAALWAGFAWLLVQLT
jgi:hypothetical protein